MEDSKIILLLQEKPALGIHGMVRRYTGLIKTVVGRILPGHHQDIEECVADTFVGVWKNVGNLDSIKTNLKGYLLCTARNAALNRYKVIKRKQTISLDDDILQVASEENIEVAVLLEEDIQQLIGVLVALTEPDREIMLRRYFLFEPVKEIAREMGLDPEQVKKRLYRTKKWIKTKLEERGVTR